MIQTVWLKSNLIRSFSTADNILFFAYKNILDYFGVSRGDLFLFEPDGALGLSLHCTADASFCCCTGK